MRKSLFSFTILLTLFTLPAVSQTYWQHDPATSGDWSDPANWSIGEPTGAGDAYVQNGGTVVITQDGEAVDYLYLGALPNQTGTALMNSGTLSSDTVYLGVSGVGNFVQTGGSHLLGKAENSYGGSLYLGYSGGQGNYTLSGNGQLTARTEYIGGDDYSYGLGNFTQTGGTNTLREDLYIGSYSDSQGTSVGTYELSGTGQLSAVHEYVGSSGGIGVLKQTGGTNTVNYLAGDANSTFTLTGGTLQIQDGLDLAGSVDLKNGTATISAGSAIINLSRCNIENYGQTALTVGANSLVIYAPGANPADVFTNFHTDGLLHQAGTILNVPTDKGFAGTGDIDDPVQCAGTITASEFINLNAGVSVSGNGVVNLGMGVIKTDNMLSLISGGQVTANKEYVGYTGAGIVTQTAGQNSIPVDDNYDGGALYIGYNTQAKGVYNLTGSGSLAAVQEYIGYMGSGTINQDAGTNKVYVNNTYGSFFLGYLSGSSGTYNLSGTGSLWAMNEYIGGGYPLGPTAFATGTGNFNQTGGSNATDYMYVGETSRYTLAGGTLQISDGLALNGILDFVNSNSTLAFGSAIVNLSNGQVLNSQNASLTVGENSLTIYAPGQDPRLIFRNFQTGGILHQAGTTLVVPSGQTIRGDGSIDDFVQCAGTILSLENSINLKGGIGISDNGYVSLGYESYIIADNDRSLVTGGQLTAATLFVGYAENGRFIQRGGNITLNSSTFSDFGLCLGGGSGWDSGSEGQPAPGTGTYTLEGGQLNSSSEVIGASGTGIFNQTGGINSLTPIFFFGGGLSVGGNVFPYSYVQSVGNGTYNLSGGQLVSPVEYIGAGGSGVFNQTGGTNVISSSYSYGFYDSCLWLGGTDYTTIGVSQVSGNGVYNLTGGTLSVAGGSPSTSPAGIVLFDGSEFNLGDAHTTGIINEAASTYPSSVDLTIGVIGSTAGKGYAVFRGWGTVSLKGRLTNNGQIVADGYGTDRTLDLTAFSSLANDRDNTSANGWFAQNHGKLVLPSLNVDAENTSVNWGESSDDSAIDLVNSVRLAFTNVTQAGTVSGSLLASDRNDVAIPFQAVGVWQFIPAGLIFDSVALTFRYDDGQAAELGLPEAGLKLFHSLDGQTWSLYNATVDCTNKWLSAGGLTSLGYFAVGNPFAADANIDGKVDAGDLGILAANYGSTTAAWSLGDFNGDGKVDVSDLGILAANYGFGTAGSVPTPEPATLLLFLATVPLTLQPKNK